MYSQGEGESWNRSVCLVHNESSGTIFYALTFSIKIAFNNFICLISLSQELDQGIQSWDTRDRVIFHFHLPLFSSTKGRVIQKDNRAFVIQTLRMFPPWTHVSLLRHSISSKRSMFHWNQPLKSFRCSFIWNTHIMVHHITQQISLLQSETYNSSFFFFFFFFPTPRFYSSVPLQSLHKYHRLCHAFSSYRFH